jgi:hypothetical protein
MSLDSLKKLRVDGYKPKAVHVLVGDFPLWANSETDTVCVKFVKGMDLRPLVGLPVSIFQLGDCDALLTEVINAVEAAKPESLAVASNHGMVGLSPEHERILDRLKTRYLCKF